MKDNYMDGTSAAQSIKKYIVFVKKLKYNSERHL